MLDLGIAPYVCIHCGYSTQALYKEYGSCRNLKLCSCDLCGQTVDEYVESDTAIVLIDAVLQKLKVYRHILYNCRLQAEWKFAIVLLLCDAYQKGVQRRQSSESKELVYLELEWEFYLMCLLALIENVAFISVVTLILYMSHNAAEKARLNLRKIISSLILSNYGKIFIMPAILWGPDMDTFHTFLLPVFIFISEVRVCTVLCNSSSSVTAVLAVIFGTMARFLISHLGDILYGCAM